MTTADDYPLFVPPAHLARKGRDNWNADEASEYRDWLLQVIEKRVNELVERLEESYRGSPSEHLLALGEKAVLLLGDVPFSAATPTGRWLTNAGYALAANMGLLTAKYLLQKLPGQVKWETIRKPKSDLSYNLPVLKGFSFSYLDPVGSSIAEASAILRGEGDAGVWKKIYEFWMNKALN